MGTEHFSGGTSQEPEAETKVNIAQRDQLWKQAMKIAEEGKLDKATKLFEQVYSIEETLNVPCDDSQTTCIAGSSTKDQLSEMLR